MTFKPNHARILSVEPLEPRALLSGYAFTPIAVGPGPWERVYGPPSLNAAGDVAYLVEYNRLFQCAYSSSGAGLGCSGDFIASSVGRPVLNDAGVAAVRATFLDLEYIYVTEGGEPRTLYSTADPLLRALAESADINAAGTVAFWAALRDGGAAVFTGDGDSLTTIADTTGPFRRFHAPPSLNAWGQVAFTAALTDGPAGVFIGDGAGFTTVAVAGDTFRDFGLPSRVNASGAVAFSALLPSGAGSGVFVGDGQTLVTVVDAGGPFEHFGSAALTDGGRVAFPALLRGVPALFGWHGIFTGPDPETDKVVAAGDELFGSTVLGVDFFRDGLNDAGQVAFFALLADNRTVIARADPLPEPGGAPGHGGPLIPHDLWSALQRPKDGTAPSIGADGPDRLPAAQPVPAAEACSSALPLPPRDEGVPRGAAPAPRTAAFRAAWLMTAEDGLVDPGLSP